MPRKSSKNPCIDCGAPCSRRGGRCQRCASAFHHRRKSHLIPPPNPSGLCMCGCGQKTRIARFTSQKRGDVAGAPVRYVYGHKSRTKRRDLASFYDVDPQTGCWIWHGPLDVHGYGRYCIFRGGRSWNIRAHRAVYEEIKGEIPNGLVIDHRCPAGPNRACVNPDHLVPCTNADNTHSSRKVCKLTPDDVAKIRDLSGKMSQREIAGQFGITQQQVSKIVRRHRWADV